MSSRILVVEDDEDMRDTLLETLEEEGFKVAGASSGDEALALAQGGPFDLVVTDVRMAGRDGLDTLAELRRLQPSMKSIVITGYASEDAPTRAIRVQASDYLYKPFSRRSLLDSVQGVLSETQERGRLQHIMDSVASGYRKVLDAIAGRPLVSLEEKRDRAFMGFYVALRSRKLSADAAQPLWETLEALERDREALRDGEPAQAALDALGAGYQYVADVLSAGGAAPPLLRSDAGLSRESFMRLYKGVLDGRVQPLLLTLAPALRQLETVGMLQSEELAQLYIKTWGEPSAA